MNANSRPVPPGKEPFFRTTIGILTVVVVLSLPLVAMALMRVESPSPGHAVTIAPSDDAVINGLQILDKHALQMPMTSAQVERLHQEEDRLDRILEDWLFTSKRPHPSPGH